MRSGFSEKTAQNGKFFQGGNRFSELYDVCNEAVVEIAKWFRILEEHVLRKVRARQKKKVTFIGGLCETSNIGAIEYEAKPLTPTLRSGGERETEPILARLDPHFVSRPEGVRSLTEFHRGVKSKQSFHLPITLRPDP